MFFIVFRTFYKSNVSKHVCDITVFIGTAHNMLTQQMTKTALGGLGQKHLFPVLLVLRLHRSIADSNSGNACSTSYGLENLEQPFQWDFKQKYCSWFSFFRAFMFTPKGSCKINHLWIWQPSSALVLKVTPYCSSITKNLFQDQICGAGGFTYHH